MRQKECPSCAMEVDEKYSVCPICGYEFPTSKSTVKWIAILMALLLAWPILSLVVRLIRTVM